MNDLIVSAVDGVMIIDAGDYRESDGSVSRLGWGGGREVVGGGDGDGAGDRPLLTFMASGRSDRYQAGSCHPGCFTSERHLSLLPPGRNRPNVAVQL